MKWFQHLSNSANDNLIFEAIELFGGDGYMVFFIVLEILADELDIHNPGICSISVKKLRKNCQISVRKLTKILRFFDEKARKNPKTGISFFVKFNTTHVVISCPKFKKLCDEYTRKKLAALDQKNPDKLRSDSNNLPTRPRHRHRQRLKYLTGAPKKNGASGFIFNKKNMGGGLEKIVDLCEQIESLILDSHHEINIYAWVQDKININGHPAAIIEALEMLIARWQTVLSPWPYITAIFELKNGNYWETEHIAESKKFRDFWLSNRKIQDLIKSIRGENPDDEKTIF
jgi:hypothetical protein